MQAGDSSGVTRNTFHGISLLLMLGMAITLATCGDKSAGEVKAIKQQVQRAYGTKEFSKALGLSQKGLTLARRTLLIKLAEENGDTLTAGERAVFVSQGVGMATGKDPQPVYRTETMYPPEQYRRKIEGDVEIAYSLDPTGAVTEARISKATPPQIFDQAALESFRKWRFTPMLDKVGRPIVASGFKFTLAFRMGR